MIDVEKCCMTRYPAKVLAKEVKPIENIDDDVRKLVTKMTDIMIGNKGMGLAGPQAGVGLAIFIISLDASRDNVRVYINPKVTPIDDDMDSAEEGCLSVPGIWPKIRRYKRCKVTATDLDGKVFTEEADGIYARCLQHEYDHLQGMTIADKMGSAARIANRRTLKRLEAEYGSGK